MKVAHRPFTRISNGSLYFTWYLGAIYFHSPKIRLFIARHHTDARYWYSNYVRPSRSGIRWKRLNCRSFFTNHSSFISIKHLYKIPTGSPHTGALNTGGV